MFKKLLIAASLVASMNVVADPILLPGGVSVPNPATPNASNGTGNIVNTLEFVQFFKDDNGEVVNLGDVGPNGVNSLTGFGTLLSEGNPGDFLCPSCSLAFEFGGLGIEAGLVDFEDFDPQTGQFETIQIPGFVFNPQNSFFNVYIVDEINVSLTDLLTDGAGNLNQTASDDFIDETNDTLFLSGVFSEVNYNPDFNINGNFALGGLGAGSLTAGVDINDLAPGEGIANGNVLSDTVTQAGTLSAMFDAVAFSLSSTFFGTSGDILTVAQENDGNLSANVVSTPATLGLFGLALMGMGLVRRNKKA